jgi:hypothetical protein
MGVMWLTEDWIKYTEDILSRKLIKVDNIVCDLLHHIGILLTFGLCCPVLAILISVYVSMYVLTLLLVLGRFLMWLDSNKAKDYSVISEALELASYDVSLYIGNCMWEVVFMTSVFFALLCWDMASDKVYWKQAVWIPVITFAIPMVMWLCYFFWSKYLIEKDEGIQNKSSIYDRNGEVIVASNRSESDNIELRLSLYPGHKFTSNGNSNMDASASDEYDNEVISPLSNAII